MRLTKSCPVTPQPNEKGELRFSGPHGEAYRIAVLEHDMIRVQVWPDGTPRLDRTWMVVDREGSMPREGRPRDDLSPFSQPEYTKTQTDTGITLRTDHLQVEVNLDDFSLLWRTAEGSIFASDTRHRAYPYDRAGRSVFHYMARREDEHYYGFGERSGDLDKYGRRLRMVNLDSLGYSARTGDPLYKHFPFYITYIPSQQIAYGLFYDNLASCAFDLGSEISAYHGFYRYYHAEDGDIDYTLIYGPTIPEVVAKFSQLTGRPLLPPRWSLGYLGSTMTYTDAVDADRQLRQFVDLCQQHNIPCDLFHLSSGYTTGEEDGLRYVFNWNTKKVPDPAEMVDYFGQAGIHLSANIKPYFLTSHPHYAELRAQGAFIHAADADAPEHIRLWSGGAFETHQGAYLDFTNPSSYDWWKTKVKQQLLDYGIVSTWNDNNEFEIWDDEAHCHGFGQSIRIALARPLQTLLMTMASYEAQREHAPDQRPFVLCRSGLPGIQRYAQTWSGDNDTSWETLRYNIPMGLGMSLSGAPNTGHDVGGFFGPRPEPELFIRWVQNGVFHPRFTIHSYNTDGTVNEPWMYPEILPIVREWIHFRYRLIPLLYTLLFRAAQTGEPIIRPLVYHFPDDPRCHTESFDFLLGDSLLVASVLEPGARTRRVYLPAGVDWLDFYTGTYYHGGQEIDIDAPIERIPLLVRAGGIIPMGRVMQHVGAQPDDLREAFLFPGETGQTRFTWVEDDGVSMAYQNGEFTTVTVLLDADPDAIRVQVSRKGDYELSFDRLHLVLPPGETRPLYAPNLGPETIREDGRRAFVLSL